MSRRTCSACSCMESASYPRCINDSVAAIIFVKLTFNPSENPSVRLFHKLYHH
ncbi:hypothetical protein PSP6_440392 [Paraburkholderia tropica]|nr:hypothetical protein PSP6_440392 [Paraburkholderia tropica]